MLKITSVRTNSAGDLIEVCSERAQHPNAVLPFGVFTAARVNGGKWMVIRGIRPVVVGGIAVSGVIDGKTAIYAAEIAAATESYRVSPPTLSQMLDQRAGLVAGVALAGGRLDRAMARGDTLSYATASVADRSSCDLAAAKLAAFDAINPSLAAMSADATTTNIWT